MASRAENRRGQSEPEPRPIIVKKVIVEDHGGHHGGAWKVAYADFVTAMMAFFLLMWLLGATTEKQRHGIADYFTPTLVQMKLESAGSDGLLGGDSLMAKDDYPEAGGQNSQALTIPRDSSGTAAQNARDYKSRDRIKFEQIKKQLEERLKKDPALKRLRKNIRFTETREGLRIDLVDEADFSMFKLATDQLLPRARALLQQVAGVVADMPNDLIIRGHTDALPYASGQTMNNWLLSSARAEATRKALAVYGVTPIRFARIEGVADKEPYAPDNIYDPRNRRMSITLAWSKGGEDSAPTPGAAEQESKDQPREESASAMAAQPAPKAKETALASNGLPSGAHLSR